MRRKTHLSFSFFQPNQKIDSDDKVLQSKITNKRAIRDIVQFVAIKDLGFVGWWDEMRWFGMRLLLMWVRWFGMVWDEIVIDVSEMIVGKWLMFSD